MRQVADAVDDPDTVDFEAVHHNVRSFLGCGGTHHATQRIQGLGRAVYLVAASNYADQYAREIDRHVVSMEEASELPGRDGNWAEWEERLLVEDDGDMLTHKTYIMAAALGTSAVLTDNPENARDWSVEAARIARQGMESQRDDGVNPERGGHDVTYQAYGTWLAQVYLGTLAPDDPYEPSSPPRSTGPPNGSRKRVAPNNGQIDIEGSTRTCLAGEPERLDVAPMVRVLLVWRHSQPGREDLVDLAGLVRSGARNPGNPCPSKSRTSDQQLPTLGDASLTVEDRPVATASSHT